MGKCFSCSSSSLASPLFLYGFPQGVGCGSTVFLSVVADEFANQVEDDEIWDYYFFLSHFKWGSQILPLDLVWEHLFRFVIL